MNPVRVQPGPQPKNVVVRRVYSAAGVAAGVASVAGASVAAAAGVSVAVGVPPPPEQPASRKRTTKDTIIRFNI